MARLRRGPRSVRVEMDGTREVSLSGRESMLTSVSWVLEGTTNMEISLLMTYTFQGRDYKQNVDVFSSDNIFPQSAERSKIY